MNTNLTLRPLLIAALTLHAASHAAPPRAAPPVAKTDTESSSTVIPALGQVAKAEVGSPLYILKTETKTTSYRAVTKQDAVGEMDRGYKLNLKAGFSGEVVLRNKTITMMCTTADSGGFKGLLFGNNNVSACLVDRQGNGVFDSSTFANYDVYFPLAAPVEYTVQSSDSVAPDVNPFHVEVLYQGVSKGEVKIAYREFLNNRARPAFNQDLSYELLANGPTKIGFKGMRLRVLKADSEGIEYIVDQPITPASVAE